MLKIKIEFENGSIIESIDSSDNVRSKRGEEQLRLLRLYHEKPWLLLGDTYNDMPWYWKLKIRIVCKFYDIKRRCFR